MDIAYYFQQELNKKEQETFTKTEILELLTKAEEKRIEPLLTVGDITLDYNTFTVRVGDKSVMLEKLNFKVLRHLMLNRNKVVSRADLIDSCWGMDIIVGDRTVDVCICKIKKRIENKLSITSRKGFGYILAE